MNESDTTAPALSQRLKDETWEMHQQAENGALARALVQGQISQTAFLGLVERERRLHASIDALISEHKDQYKPLDDLATDQFAHEAEYATDVVSLGGSVEGGDTDAVRNAERSILEGSGNGSAFLIGVHYVREGAKNGNRMIEPRVRAAVGKGTSHLDPDGEMQRPKWARFKETLDSLDLSEADADQAVQGAISMFQAVRDIHAEVMTASV